MSDATNERAEIMRAIEHAPVSPRGPIAPDLRGWWTRTGWFVCARDAARILERGCALPSGSRPCWDTEPRGLCVVCSQ